MSRQGKNWCTGLMKGERNSWGRESQHPGQPSHPTHTETLKPTWQWQGVALRCFLALTWGEGEGGKKREEEGKGRPKVPETRELDTGISLAVQWLGPCAFTAEGAGLIPGRGTKIPHATWHS